MGGITEDSYPVRVYLEEKGPPKEWEQAPKALSPPHDPNFVQLAPVVAYGKQSLGFGKTCPRDGRRNCSIVDGVHGQGHSRKANRFLSWVWTYDKSTAISALRRWTALQQKTSDNFDPTKIAIWWCFFCNNQFRILADREKQSTDYLARVFGERLQSVGNMFILIDSYRKPRYSQRIWCIFECFVASDKAIPCEVLAPEHAAEECNSIQTIAQLQEICSVDAAKAEATMKEDEDGIKQLILSRQGSFDRVNFVVSKGLFFDIGQSLKVI